MTTTAEQALVTGEDTPSQAVQINAPIGGASELTLEESAELAALESIVQAGKRAFLQVAAALVTIRDKRLYHAHRRGDVPAAIVVVSDLAVSTHWFAPLWDYVVAFLGRVPFATPDGSSSSPTSGTAVVGVGVDVNRFAEVFSPFGPVVARIDRLGGAE